MPLNGNTYVAPTWRNGQPPTLDPAELQAISDTLAAAQSKNTDQDSLIAALQTAVGSLQAGSAKIEVGSYVGTGTYGASKPNSITCSFAPKMVSVTGNNQSTGFVWNNYGGIGTVHDNYSLTGAIGIVTLNFNGNKASWYGDSASLQLNLSGTRYTFVAIG